MSPRTASPDDLLADDNYFHWEYNVRMTLAKKGLLEHVLLKQDAVVNGYGEPISRESPAWRTADMKALAIIAKSVSVNYQAMIRDESSARAAWEVLEGFFNRQTMHNRVALNQKLNEFKLASGGNLYDHLTRFKELSTALAAAGDPLDEQRQLVILLGSLPREYNVTVKIIENIAGVTMLQAAEMLKREYAESGHEETEVAFQMTRQRNRNPRQQSKFRGKCFNCGKTGHKQADCHSPKKKKPGQEYVFAVANASSSEWLLDSGASAHMTNDVTDLKNAAPVTDGTRIVVADGTVLTAEAMGTVEMVLDDGSNLLVNGVLYIPGLDKKLLAVAKIVERGIRVSFVGNVCELSKGGETFLALTKGSHGLFSLRPQRLAREEVAAEAVVDNATAPVQLWHARLGHPSFASIGTIQKRSSGVPQAACNAHDPNEICEGCVQGKMTVASFPRNTGPAKVKTDAKLHLIHSDVAGPFKKPSPGGRRYVVTFVDDFSRFVYVYFMRKKSEVLEHFKTFKAEVEKQHSASIRILRTDNGGEYCGNEFAKFLRDEGIVHQTSVPYSPQQNGLAERMNRTLVEKARAMLHYNAVDTKWWAEAINCAAYLVNRLPTAAHKETPHERWTGAIPDLSHLRVFGSKGFAQIPKERRSKLDAKAFRCMFVGYSTTSKAYRVIDLRTGRLVVARSVTLDERMSSHYREEGTTEVLHYRVQHDNTSDDEDDGPAAVAPTPEPDVDMESIADEQDDEVMGDVEMPEPVAAEIPVVITPSEVLRELPPPSDRNELVLRTNGREIVPHSHNETAIVPVRSRQRDLPRVLPDIPSPPLEELDDDLPIVPRDSAPPWAKRPRRDEDLLTYALSAQGGGDVMIPQTYREALQSPQAAEWRRAIDAEFRAHRTNATWNITRRPADANVIGSKWVFSIKRDENGSIVRYKARLVAKGYAQAPGRDYNFTYAPVVNGASLRIFASRANELDYEVEQCGVDTAFLYGEVEERVYMAIPEGLEVNDPREVVCQLDKSLYGLKQSAAVWHKRIRKAFIERGFTPLQSEPCIFMRPVNGGGFIYVALYVDDMLIAAPTKALAEEVIISLEEEFRLKRLGAARLVVGMEIRRDRSRKAMRICQQRYIHDVVERFGQAQAKSSVNPCEVATKLLRGEDEDGLDVSVYPYRSLIGSLLYLSMGARPDIVYIVGKLSKYCERPTMQHWKAGIKVVRYLKATASHGLCFDRDAPLCGYSDSDWAADVNDRRSVSGIMVMYNGAPVIFKSKTQKSVALSTAEAEYVALSLCAQETIWARTLLAEMGVDHAGATTIFVDNQAAISMTKQIGYSHRCKHIDLRFHYVHEKVEDGVVITTYVPTSQQLADFLTKPLASSQFRKLVAKTGIHASAQGEC